MKEEDKKFPIGNVEPREIVDEMKESYLDYAMSVIVMRALPDVRDGSKPVHRRILYAMSELGLRHNVKFLKCARIVGDVLGKYHPHGDMAVYDALSRMAQDFSLRYPLVDGQGNFGCFTKDTKVALADGRNLSFGELVEEYKEGKKNYAYTVNKKGLISIAEIKQPRLTKKNAEIMKVILDNGEEIKCTPNHQFMIKDGSYKEAKDLKQEESLMPLYQKLSEKTDAFNREGYVLIYQNKKNEWVLAHHLADNYNLSNKKYLKTRGKVRHHIDFDKLNNAPANITRMQWKEHWQVHYENAAALHQNEEYRNKLAEGRKRFWSDPKNKEKYSKNLSLRNVKNWHDQEYRKKMSRLLSDINKEYIKNHPEKRAEFSERALKTLRRLWKDPKYKKLFNEKIVRANQNRTTNNTGKVKFLNICREALKRYKRLNRELYEQVRSMVYPYAKATLWSTGFTKYYKGNTELLFKELNHNHKVMRSEGVHQKEDVYDLTIDGSHNFALAAGIFVHNSVDGDSPAAMRYTEARMTAVAEEMLFDIEKETVDFVDNYDGTRKEPKVLPARVPQLLLNGQTGIAVGMATNIPPHNLGELVDATIHLIDHPKADVMALLEFVKGPDFPTGGIVYNQDDIVTVYSTGRGPLTVRGKAEIVEAKSGHHQIIISEIPFQVNKSSLIEKMADLVREKTIEGIRDIRDESDKDGLRIALDLKNDAFPQKILNKLYKLTDLQRAFHCNILALVDGIQPTVLSLKSVLEYFIAHRRDVVERRTRYDLGKAKDRAHILEGLKKALDHIDKIIATIKKSASKEDAHVQLVRAFALTEIQAHAILEMKLQTLAGLERKKIEDELEEKKKLIAYLSGLLKDPKKILGVVKKELEEIKEKYADARRTKVVKGKVSEFKEEDLIPDEETMIALSYGGYIKRVNPAMYRTQRRGGKGIIGMETKEEDVVEHLLSTNAHANILFFTNKGKVFQTKAYEVPEASRVSKGKAIANILDIQQQDAVTALVPLKEMLGKKGKSDAASTTHLIMATKNGIIKKVKASEFTTVRSTGVQAITLKGGDLLKWVRVSNGDDEIILLTKSGKAIRFHEKSVRAMGRTAGGVRAITLKGGDEVVGVDVIPAGRASEFELLVISENGLGKKTTLDEYRAQGRGGQGIKTYNVSEKTGKLVASMLISQEEEDLIAISKKGQVIRTQLVSIPALARATQGVRVMRLAAGDRVASIVCL